MLSESKLDLIKKWSENTDELENSIEKENASIYRELNEGILNLIKNFENQTKIYPTSKEGFSGIEDLYSVIQLQFEGGEDLLKD